MASWTEIKKQREKELTEKCRKVREKLQKQQDNGLKNVPQK